MVPCPKCGWQNQDNAQKCANCFQALRGGGAQPVNQSPAGQMQQPQPMQGQQPYGAPGGVQAPPGPGYPGQQRPAMQYYEYVGWARLGSSFIDGLIYIIVAFVVLMANGVDFTNPVSLQSKMASLQVTQIAFVLLYEVGLTATCGATLGKMALGMKILKTDGSPIGFGIALGRCLLKLVISAVPCGGLSYLTILFSPINQGWYDKLLNTMVVKK